MSSISQYDPYKNAIALLKKTKYIIETKGWGQGHLYEIISHGNKWEKCNFCLMGALFEAKDFLESSWASYRIVRNSLDKTCHGSLISFNDRTSMTKGKVIAALDMAIDDLTLKP